MKQALLIYFPLLLLYGCATQSMPAGGAKDTKPPRVIASKPDSAAVNFHKNIVDLEFDEYVNLRNAQEQIIISPLLNKKPNIQQKGKHVVIQIKDTLKKNTTYTINFGSSIADITENNVLNNYSFAFSTGPYIDSLILSGKVENAFTKMPEKDVLIMLYDSFYDSVPIKMKPLYFTKTNANGHFIITNIATGSYKLFALQDANSDYLFNQPAEAIAFTSEPIALSAEKTDSSISLHLFTEDRTRQRVQRVRASGYGKLVMTFSKPLSPAFEVKTFKKAHLRPSDTLARLWQVQEHNKNNDSLTWWFSNDALDSLHLIISDTNIKDTVHLALVKRKEQKKQDKKTFYTLTNLQNHIIEANVPYDVVFNHPVRDFNTQGLVLKEDSTVVTNYTLTQDSSCKRIFHLRYKWKEEHLYHLFIPKGAITNIFGDGSDTLQTFFKVRPEKEYGVLLLKLDLKDRSHQYLLQLTDEKGGLVQEDVIKSSLVKRYSFLKPQKYKARLIFDDNNNGKWDTGNYLKHIQPEKVLYYKGGDLIPIRADWEVDNTWKVEE